MPSYEYFCAHCEKRYEAYHAVAERDNETCCGHPAFRMLSVPAKPVVCEYYSESLGAHITGPRHRDRVMKEKNISESSK